MTAEAQTQAAATKTDPVLLAQEEAKTAATTLATANAYVIDSADMAECAAEDMNRWVTKAKELNETRLTLTRPLDESKSRIIALFAAPIDAYKAAAEKVKDGLLAWNKKESARIAEENRIAEEKRKADEEAASKAAAEIQGQMEAAAETGDYDALDELEQKAMIVEQSSAAVLYAPPRATTVAKVSGASVRSNWKAEVVDLLALVKAVAAGEASIDLLEANTSVLNKRAKALEMEFKVPGVRVYNDPIVAASGRKR